MDCLDDNSAGYSTRGERVTKIIRILCLPIIAFVFVFVYGKLVFANNYDEGCELFAQEKFQAAIPILEEHCTQFPEDPGSGDLLAQCYVKTKQLDKASDRLKVVLKHHPAHHQSQFLMGIILLSQKKNDEALKHVSEAIEADPKNASYNGVYGRLLINGKKYHDAKKALQIALESDPENAELNLDCGRVLFYLGEYENALQPLTIASQSESTTVYALMYLGETQLRLKKYDDAIATLQKATHAKPDDDKLFYILGQACEMKTGDKAQSPKDIQPAIDAFSKAVQLKSNNADYRYKLGKSFESAALTIYEKCSEDKGLADQALSFLNKAKNEYEAAIKINALSSAEDEIVFVEKQITKISNLYEVESVQP